MAGVQHLAPHAPILRMIWLPCQILSQRLAQSPQLMGESYYAVSALSSVPSALRSN
jgi:hypothetical protein